MFQLVTPLRNVYAKSACVDIRPFPKTDVLANFFNNATHQISVSYI